jgi:hypothetical protein
MSIDSALPAGYHATLRADCLCQLASQVIVSAAGAFYYSPIKIYD